MRRNWILSTAGVLLALAAVTLLLVLGSPPGGGGTADGLEPNATDSTPAPAVPELDGAGGSIASAEEDRAAATRVSLTGGSEGVVEILGPFTEIFVHGTVTTIGEDAVKRARVRAFPAKGEKLLVVYTDASGAYRIGPLKPGSRRLFVDGRNCYKSGAVLALDGTASLVRQDLRLRRVQKIAVRVVTSRGVPTVKAASAGRSEPTYLVLGPVATREDPGDSFPFDPRYSEEHNLGRFDASFGAYQSNLSEALLGTLTLRKPGAVWLSLVAGRHILRKRPIAPSVEEVTFVVDPEEFVCAISGRLVAAESGLPIAGRVWLSETRSRDNWPLTVGEDGFVRFEVASPGERWLIAAASRRVDVQVPLNLVPGEPYECGSIPLHEPVTLRGRVTIPGGVPRALSLRWGLIRPSTGKVVWDDQQGIRSKADGSFVISGLVPGDYVLASRCFPGSFNRQNQYRVAEPLRVDATLGSIEGLELVASPTTLVILIVRGIEAKQSLNVEAINSSGFVVARSPVTQKIWRRVLQLLPGEHELVLSSGGKEVHRRRLLVGAARERIEVKL